MAFAGKLPGEHCGWCRRALGIQEEQDSPKGAKLVLAAAAVFLVPLLLALLGAVSFSGWGAVGGTVGGVGGLLLGLMGAVGLRWWASHRAHRHDGQRCSDRNQEEM